MEKFNTYLEKAKKYYHCFTKKLAILFGDFIKWFKDQVSDFEYWYNHADDSIQEMTSLFIALLIVILIRIILIH